MKRNLIKVVKELNIGIRAAVDFLNKESIKIDARPNTQIDEEIYNKLVEEFSKKNKVTPQLKADLTMIEEFTTMLHDHSATPKIAGKIELPKFKPKNKVEGSKNFKKDKGNFLQDIWQLHTDVQEQMLRLRSVPIKVLPESAKVIGDKLRLTADENEGSYKIVEEIASVFKISSNEIDTIKGFFFSNTYVDIETKRALSKRAIVNFINFQGLPVIDGYIKQKKSPIEDLKEILKYSNCDYRLDEKGRLQITIANLYKLRQMLGNDNVQIRIPETASIILPVRPNPVYFLSKKYPNIKIEHKLKAYRKGGDSIAEVDKDTKWNRFIEIHDQYLTDTVLEDFKKKFGLFLFGYEYTFYVNPEVIAKYDSKTSPHILPKLNTETNSFTFHTNVLANESKQNINLNNAYNEEKRHFNIKYTRLKKFFDSYFGEENIRFEAKFIYAYDQYRFENDYLSKQEYSESDFWEQTYNSYINEKVSVSDNTKSIGVDFNWQTENFEDIISNTQNKCPFINLIIFKDHRCNIDFEIQDIALDKVENTLRENFPSIQTKRNDKKGTLYFCQQYQKQEQGYNLKQIIESEINTLDPTLFEVGLYPIPEGKEKYIIEIDSQSKKEQQSTGVKELRGADFCVGEHTFGKLLRVNYPEMIFDISGDNFEKTKQLFESSSVSSIKPNLTGDLEKISRLKNSLNNIIKGTNIQNPNLKNFIFDASQAKRTENIEEHIAPLGDTFRDLENHLLNNKVNEPQKQAIIKTLLAQDLAIVQGPPGTGKSTAIAEMVWQHVRLNPKERILLTSEANLAVDNAIDRIVNSSHNLVKPIRFGGEDKLEIEGLQFSIDVMQRWVENGITKTHELEQNNEAEFMPQKLILENWIDNIRQRINVEKLGNDISSLWNNMLLSPTKEIRQLFYSNYIKNCNLVAATCSSIGQLNSKMKPTNFYRTYQEVFGKNKEIKFTTVIQDESSKATPAELSLPLIYGKKNIIIGDHRQLPPLLDKEGFLLSLDFLLDRTEKDEEKRKISRLKSFVLKHFNEMEISHFERLFEKIDDSLKGVFNLQYRMHPDINEVIKQFYINDGGLKCGLVEPEDLGVNNPDMGHWASRYHGIEIDELITKDTHTVWVDTNSPEFLDGTSRTNYGEVEAIRSILGKLRESNSFRRYQSFWTDPEDQQIGLITFYGKQIKLLQDLSTEFRDIPLRVSTVDRFQGMERNIIIVSMVRSNRIASDKTQKPDTDLYGPLGYPEQKDLGFAQSPNRLNVALSRAKRLLIIVGNSELFRQKPIYNNVYKTIVENPNGRLIKCENL